MYIYKIYVLMFNKMWHFMSFYIIINHKIYYLLVISIITPGGLSSAD